MQEYTSNPLAEDSDDDKKILRAQTRAERKAKAEKAQKKSSQKSGVCYNCFIPGHWQYECPEKRRTKLSTYFFIES